MKMCHQKITVFTLCNHRSTPITTNNCPHYHQYYSLLTGTPSQPPQNANSPYMQALLSRCRDAATQTLVPVPDYCQECKDIQSNMMRAMQETAARNYEVSAE